MDDTVQLRCHRCKSVFRDKARRVQSGYSRQCVTCETIMFFEDGSIDKNVQRTLRDAKRVRKALREHEAEKIARGAVRFRKERKFQIERWITQRRTGRFLKSPLPSWLVMAMTSFRIGRIPWLHSESYS